MSIQSEITRINGLKGTLRTKLVALGLVQASADLSGCVDAVDGIENRGAVEGSIATADGSYTIAAGYHNGKGKVAISAAERAKIIAGNIKSGVTLLGVVGTYIGEALKAQAKSVVPSKAKQTITPDEGYDALSSVEVAPIPDAYQDVSGVTATAADVLANKIIVDSTGAQKAGTMPNNGAVAATIDGLTATSYTVPAGYHSGAGKVQLTNAIETALAAI